MFWGFCAYREWNIMITHFNPSTKKEGLSYLEGQKILTDLLAINFLGYPGSNLPSLFVWHFVRTTLCPAPLIFFFYIIYNIVID